MLKLILYIICIPLVVFSVDGINLNQIFKRNKVIQARAFYVILILALSYLLTNFIYDFYTFDF